MSASVDFLGEPSTLLEVSQPTIVVSISSLIVQHIEVLALITDSTQENCKGSNALVHTNPEEKHRVIFDRFLLCQESRLPFSPNSKFEQLEIVNVATNRSRTGANILAYLKRLIS